MTDMTSTRDQIDLTITDDAQVVDCLHLLPCAVKYSGKASTDTYFLPLEQQPNKTYEATFRGRQLYGRKIRLPDTYTGHIVIDSVAKSEVDDSAFESEACSAPVADQRVVLSAGQFNSLTVWEHDRVPAEDDDEFITSLEWISVAASIHADCTDSN
ncbi:hypothetical protein GGI21_001342 [Coemansia aciculifera]|uniref:Uncharacterized protein n=1 Tax=Coemansia aciculifera TaxID=417176 RepID=A0ACC1M3X2_9FUNG|nr:hypothetical protein IWW38_002638 [Coemansia aciculifera]KAJ2909973.1 hypothetical protein GGI21_001342 [Coemansia aciculifera]